MIYNRAIDRILLVLVLSALFVYASTRPVTRLTPEMPKGYVWAPRRATSKEREAEQQVARAYWNCAVTVIQWKDTYGAALPASPPDDFQIDPSTFPGVNPPKGSRLRYWHKLRKFWIMPDSWTTEREWSTRWLTDPLNQGIESLREYWRNLSDTG